MHHSSFSTSKSAAPLVLAIVAALSGAAALFLLFGDLARHRLPWLLAFVAGAFVFALLAVRKLAHTDDATRIEPTFETSILAFPPEPKFERRPLRPQ